ncbi:MAG: ABC transporter ATP-binding protein [Anaerolineae bacterium]|nr:ABC transporter ATP-binding protein [Anaerolineae bacterium]
MKLCIEGLTFAYSSRTVLEQINLEVNSAITVVIGPNAVGKTTLLKCICGMLKPRGRILLDGRDIGTFTGKEAARIVGYLPQEIYGGTALTVLEAVLLGKLHSLRWRVSDDDLDITLEVLEELGIANLALRSLRELSGGQRQLVSIAQVLVQRPGILLMDEPTSNLDLQHQLEILTLIKRMTRERGLITIIAMHDLNLAARYADNIVVLHQGRVYASGRPASVLTAEVIRAVYGVEARVSVDGDGVPLITPVRSVRDTK